MSRLTRDLCDWLHVPHSPSGTNRPPWSVKTAAGPILPHGVSPISSTNQKAVLAGGGGYLGRRLARSLRADGWEVCVLTRGEPGNDPEGWRRVPWDGQSLGMWVSHLDGADVLINLAGRSVNCRYHSRNRKAMMDSRIESTHVLGRAIGRCRRPPAVWLNSSTATIYKHTFGPAWEEDGEIGWAPEAKDRFSIEIATAWERVFDEAEAPRTRKVKLRSAIVLGRDPDSNNALVPLRRLARLGLGGPMGHGRQYVSWIHESDFCRAVRFIVDHEALEGPVNVAAPTPLSNADMMAILRRRCRRTFGLPATPWMLELGAFVLRTETELILKSRRVVPGKLRRAGFQFEFETFDQALADLLAPASLPKSADAPGVGRNLHFQ